MSDPRLLWLLARARQREMERLGAVQAMHRPPLPQRTAPAAQSALTLRYGFPDDAGVISRLAALDCAAAPEPPLLLAEVEGELRAAISLSDGSHIADPFHPTSALLDLLRARAAQLDGSSRTRRPWLTWLRGRGLALR